jgi:hypothetical protein
MSPTTATKGGIVSELIEEFVFWTIVVAGGLFSAATSAWLLLAA